MLIKRNVKVMSQRKFNFYNIYILFKIIIQDANNEQKFYMARKYIIIIIIIYL